MLISGAVMDDNIITINAGSSSIKFAIYTLGDLKLLYSILIEDLQNVPNMRIKNGDGDIVLQSSLKEHGHHFAISQLIKWIESKADKINIVAIGHRVVHGGTKFLKPIVIDNSVISELKKIIPLAPLHQPHNIEAIEVFTAIYPNIKQIACFDTAFHDTQEDIIKSYPLPEKYFNEGIIRYGFHGLSYEYICSTLDVNLKDNANGKIIIAHLGNGASMCAVSNKISKVTTMGFTALDGLMMGTRAGNIDPGIILYLAEECKMQLNQIKSLLYKESGLKGVSGLGNDMRDLLESDDERAKFAIDMFCIIAARSLSGLIPVIGGVDAVIFTAGVGENSSLIREKICNYLGWLGIKINNKSNALNDLCISCDDSDIKVYVIPTNEELIIARHTKELFI